MEVADKASKKNFYILNFLSILFFLFIFFYFVFNSKPADTLEVLNAELSKKECTVSESYFEKSIQKINSEYKIVKKSQDIYIFPEYKNLKCLKKVSHYSIDLNENTVYIYLFDNPKFLTYLSRLVNFLLFFNLIILKKNQINIFFSYLILNFWLELFFSPDANYLKILIPYNDPESLNGDNFFRILFLLLLINKLKYISLILLTLIIVPMFMPDYLGIFVLIYVILKNDLRIKKFKILFFLIPIFHWILRLFYALKSIDFLWIMGGQRIYHGYSKYYDMQWNMLTFRCNGDKNYSPSFNSYFSECPQLYGGFLDNFIKINYNPMAATMIALFIFTILFLIIYFLLFTNKIFINYQLLIILFFLSPPVNFAIFQGNPDIFIFVIVFFLFKPKMLPVMFRNLILFLLFAFKLHPFGALLGSILINFSKKINLTALVNLILIIVSVFLLFKEFFYSESYFSKNFTLTWEEAYGYYHYSNLFGNYINKYFIYFIFVILTIYVSQKKVIYNCSRNLKVFEKNQYFNVLLVWFLFTSFYSNNSYRLINFLFLFLIFYVTLNSRIRYLSIVLYFLIPFPILSPNVVQYLYFIVYIVSLVLFNSITINYLIYILKLKISACLNKSY